MALTSIHGNRYIIIGVVHLPPLPGSPRGNNNSMEELIERAVKDAQKLEEGGVDAVIIENYGDKPYRPRIRNALTIAAMSVIVSEVKRAVSIPIGVNLLRNSGPEALAIAYAALAEFIRVNAYCETRIAPEGVLKPVMYEIEAIRQTLGRHIAVFADIDVKHSLPSTPHYDPIIAAKECVERGYPDALIVTGPRTGEAPAPGYVAAIKSAVPIPVFVGSGVTLENIRAYIEVSDGAIIGSFFKRDGRAENEVELERVKRLIRHVSDYMGKRK